VQTWFTVFHTHPHTKTKAPNRYEGLHEENIGQEEEFQQHLFWHWEKKTKQFIFCSQTSNFAIWGTDFLCMPSNTSQYEIEKDSTSHKIHPELVWYSPSDPPVRTKNQRKKREK